MSSDEGKVAVPSPRVSAVREIPLVNRTEEMQILRDAADRAIQGEGGVVFLHGEAGIGKTRLARELTTYAGSRGMQVLSGRCPALFRMDGVPPYILWEEIIKDYMEVCTLEDLHKVIGSYPIEVSKLIPELKQKLRLVPESFPLSPEHSRDRLFEAVTQFITNISKEKPLLVILDDLQWTDQSSLLLLLYLARGIYRESLLLLGAYRDIDVDKKHPLSPVLAELNRERLLQSVSLRRMSLDDVTEMIKQLLEQDDIPRELSKLVYEKTRGNPFFVEEVIKSLKEEKILFRKGEKWEVKEVSGIQFPETVKEVIKNRVDRLDEESQHVLRLASFIGRDFTFEVIREATGIEEDKLLELIEKMLKTGLIVEREIRGEAVHSFSDVIVRDVVYEEVSLLRRKRLHGIIGSALEKACTEKIDEHLGELALHFLEGGDKDKALDYFLKAGDKAAKIYANSEAASYFQSALELLEKKDDKLRERGHVLERLGDIKMIVGKYEACLKYWRNALLLREQLREKEKVARLHRKLSKSLKAMGNVEKAEKHHQKAMQILETEPESIELAHLYNDRADWLWYAGDMDGSSHWTKKALELATKLKASEALAESHYVLGTTYTTTGDNEKGIKHLKKALKIALENGYMKTALEVYNNLAFAAGEREQKFEYFENGLELAKKLGYVEMISLISSTLAAHCVFMGDLRRAVLLAEESLVLSKKTGNMPNLSTSMGVLGFTYQALGEWDKSEQYYKEASGICQTLGDFQSIAIIHRFLGTFHLDKGEYIKAREHLEKALETFEKAGARGHPLQFLVSALLIWTYIELGEIEKAKNLVDSLEKLTLNRTYIAYRETLKAMLFRAQKKWQKSIKQFEKSLQKHKALNARRWDAYFFAKLVLSEYARVFLERDQKGDREKARKLLIQALEIFEKMGAKKDIENVKSKLAFVKTGREMAKPEPIEEVSLPSHITSGYKELDDLLFGGIPRDYAVILTSPSCDERDFLIRRFLEAGAEEGQVTFYITTKTSGLKNIVDEFPSNFYFFVCNPQADKVVKDMPNMFKLKGVENLTDVNIALSSVFRKLGSLNGSRRACVEIVSDILLQHHAVKTRRWLNSLIPDLKSEGFTTLAILDPGMHPPQEVRAVLDLFDGEINIYEKETEKGIGKFLKIKKMTNQKYSKREPVL